MDLRQRLVTFWGKLQPYHVYALICLAVAVVLAGYGYFGSTWLTAAIVIFALGGQRRFETKSIMLATQALLAREQQWREERETLLRLGQHSPIHYDKTRGCTLCGFDITHPIHIPNSYPEADADAMVRN